MSLSTTGIVTFLLGTKLTYLAPEVVNGASLSTASDVFSLGMTMLEVFSNVTSPWQDCLQVISDVVIKEALINGIRPDIKIAQLYDNDTTIIVNLITKCWHKNPACRPNLNQV